MPYNLRREEVDKYRPLLAFIRNQYESILGRSQDIPDDPSGILKAIQFIVLDLPKAMKAGIDQIEEFNLRARKALTAA